MVGSVWFTHFLAFRHLESLSISQSLIIEWSIFSTSFHLNQPRRVSSYQNHLAIASPFLSGIFEWMDGNSLSQWVNLFERVNFLSESIAEYTWLSSSTVWLVPLLLNSNWCQLTSISESISVSESLSQSVSVFTSFSAWGVSLWVNWKSQCVKLLGGESAFEWIWKVLVRVSAFQNPWAKVSALHFEPQCQFQSVIWTRNRALGVRILESEASLSTSF